MTQAIPKITISGPHKSGKSTLGMEIYEALRAAGINAVLHNEDTIADALIDHQPERLKALAERLNGEPIIIEQAYTAHLENPTPGIGRAIVIDPPLPRK